MGTITVTIEGTTVGTVATGGGIVMISNVSETDSARIIAAYMAYYSAPRRNRWFDASGNPRAPSVAETMQAWWGDVISAAMACVAQHEIAGAITQAQGALAPPISVATSG